MHPEFWHTEHRVGKTVIIYCPLSTPGKSLLPLWPCSPAFPQGPGQHWSSWAGQERQRGVEHECQATAARRAARRARADRSPPQPNLASHRDGNPSSGRLQGIHFSRLWNQGSQHNKKIHLFNLASSPYSSEELGISFEINTVFTVNTEIKTGPHLAC